MTHPSLSYQPSIALDRLMVEVSAAARQHTSTDWGAAVLNLPLMMATFGLVELSTEDKSALATTAMPDAWVCAAAELPGASMKNLARLLSALDRRGFVSIEDADRFCAVEVARERDAETHRHAKASILAAQKSAGHGALTCRLANETFDPAPEAAYGKLLEGVRDLYDATAGVASFATEKAIWVGKGLGLAAHGLKTLRKSVSD